MNDSCRVTVKPLAVRLAYLTALASLAVSSSVYAISFGHSRLLSPVGQPLQIQVPVHQLSNQERESLSVSVAAPSAWQEAGLTPPVDPATMQVAVVDAARSGSKLITIRSSQPLSSNVADLLLSVRSSSGQMQHQVSLLAPADLDVARASGGISPTGSGAVGASGAAAATSVQIRRGDTLFALARRHAVPGVSVYQWMIGVMQANPQAFINDNVNLIKAGATLNIPGSQQLTALSDREAREIFQKHATAFAQYRQRLADTVARTDAIAAQSADRGQVTAPATGSAPAPAQSPQDRLVLQPAQASAAPANAQGSGATEAVSASVDGGGQATSSGGGEASPNPAGQSGAMAPGVGTGSLTNDDQLALERNTGEARERVSQLEDNVKNLNQALQQQGTAAHEAVVEGAKAVEETVEQLKKMVEGNASAGGEPPVGASSATSGAAGIASSPSVQASSANAVSGAAESSVARGDTVSSDANPSDTNSSSTTSWLMDNLLIIISGALALIVLIVAWLLRRVGAERDDDADAVITEEMVRERLQSINLDLDDPAQTRQPEQRT